MNHLSSDVIQYIFTMVGFWRDLTELRTVCRAFKKHITWRTIVGVRLDEDNQYLLSIPRITNRLIYFDCSDNQLTFLPELPNNEYLNCSHNQLTFLPELPNNKKLNYWHNQRASLPRIPK